VTDRSVDLSDWNASQLLDARSTTCPLAVL
jgi:hypothetical protein